MVPLRTRRSRVVPPLALVSTVLATSVLTVLPAASATSVTPDRLVTALRASAPTSTAATTADRGFAATSPSSRSGWRSAVPAGDDRPASTEPSRPGGTTGTTTSEHHRPAGTVPDAAVSGTSDRRRTERAAQKLPERVRSLASATREAALRTADRAGRPLRAADVRAAAAEVLRRDPSEIERPMLHTTDVHRGLKLVGRNPFTGRLSVRYLRVDDGDVVISTS